jgi:hypothetical protein
MDAGRVASEHEVLLHVSRVEGSVTSAELVAAARRGGAPAHVVSTLERLPAREWSSAEEAAAAIGHGWRTLDDDAEAPGADAQA